MPLSPLQVREVFHLLFLRALLRSLPVEAFALKAGANLRFFFGSIRYSEDLDLDLSGVPVHVVQEKVMKLFHSAPLRDTLRTFGVDSLRLPDLAGAKKTETVQRFKIGLLTRAGEDLPTKIEFSRRGLEAEIQAEPVSAEVLAAYRLAPVILPHYGARLAALQKIRAIAGGAQPQARDIFDLHLLRAQREVTQTNLTQDFSAEEIRRTRETVMAIGYEQYRDTVVNFLGANDREAYDSPQVWNQIQRLVLSLIE